MTEQGERTVAVKEQRGGERQWPVLLCARGINVVNAEQTEVMISVQKQLIW